MISRSEIRLEAVRFNKWLHWSSPPDGVFKLDIDGSRKSSGIAETGVLIRNNNGEWLTGFSINLGVFLVTMAKLRGIYQGLLLAWEVGIRDIHKLIVLAQFK